MDTTAAAELGGVVDGVAGFWDSGGGAGGPEGWAAEKQQQQQGWGGGGGIHNRASGSATPNMEPPPKRMRNMTGGGPDGYGSGSGNFNSASPMGGFTPGPSDSRGGFGPGGGQGGSPSVKNNFPAGGPNASFSQGPSPPPLPPGTPTGDQSAGQGIPRGRGMGSIFYKTKLCSRFRHGNCPYNTNCNFAHGMEELRRPPPGWEESAGAVEGGAVVGGGGAGGGSGGGVGGGGGGNVGGGNRGGNVGLAGGANASVAPSHPSGANQGPTQGPNQGPNPDPTQGPTQGSTQGSNQGPSQSPSQGVIDMQRFHKTRPCKKYFSEMGCPYGDRCNFLHDEPSPQMVSKSGRESVVVTVVANGGGSGSGPAPASTVGGAAGGATGGGSTPNQRPPNWKTRLCNKWETTGNCPFGEKCHFAHGTAELQRYGGGPIDPSSLEGGPVSQLDSRLGINSSANNVGDGDEGLPSYPESYPQTGIMRQASGHPLQQTPRPNSGMGPKSAIVWKGPTTGISTIYGDWLEDNDWTPVSHQKYGQPLPLVGQKGTDFSSEPLARKEKDQPNSSPFLKPGNGSARIYAQG